MSEEKFNLDAFVKEELRGVSQPIHLFNIDELISKASETALAVGQELSKRDILEYKFLWEAGWIYV